MVKHMVMRALAPAVAAVGCVLAFSQGEATAQADAAAQLRELQGQVDALSAKVAALDAIIVRQERGLTITGRRFANEIVLRANPDTTRALTVDKNDAVLRFARITLIGDEISLSGSRSIALKAPAITLDGQVDAKGRDDVTAKGYKLRDN